MTYVTMVGDICEEDELETGLRREGIFSAVGSLARKMAVAITSILSGLVLSAVGFDAEVAAKCGMPEAVGFNLKLVYVIGQALGVVLGLILISFYPITRKRAIETQKILTERRAAAATPHGFI
jgi:GPH family glycoside/pentoside/hexuronide:cation symporter